MGTERVIHCHICRVYVGTIRDAKLMKGISFMCPKCIPDIENFTESDTLKDVFNSPLADSIFGTMFGKPKT